MSYSRWGHSRFYTFWRATDSNKREDQIFDIMFNFGRELTFTHKELKFDMEDCLNKCEEYCSNPNQWHMRKSIFPPSDETEEINDPPDPFEAGDREELKGYMIRFREAVDMDSSLV